MSYEIRSANRPNTQGIDGTVFVLRNAGSGATAEVWPALGFNCFRWQSPCQGQLLDLLYTDPQLFAGGRPTRSGIPILFPFPNRIRDGKFTWQGRAYQLPTNDPSKKNAIHGFACRHPWRVVDQGANAESAFLTGEFSAAQDAPEDRPLWPADYRLRVTYRLVDQGLRIEAAVFNPDKVPLPFGLGYHPYFRVPLTADGTEENTAVSCSGREMWELVDTLPTGKRVRVDAAHDLTSGQRLAGLHLDDLYTDLAGTSANAAALCWRGGLRQGADGPGVQVATTPSFREMVVFTPPHRQAVCLEPYTCATDAINLQANGIDAGWLVLAPGSEWHGVVELRVASGS